MKAAKLSTLQKLDSESMVAATTAVRRLTLTDFRCYRSLRLETDGRPVVLTGPNGAGKTNLLEAVSFLVPGRGLRRARLAEVIRKAPAGGDDSGAAVSGWAVAATVLGGDGPVEIGTGLATVPGDDSAGDRRVVKIDGAEVRSQTALGDHVTAIWLTPEMDRLFSDGASERRRFLDRLVYGFDSNHATRLGAYERGMRDRARVLRDSRRAGGAPDTAWLDALEEGLARSAVAIAAARVDLVERLGAACALGTGPFPAAGLAIDGEVEGWLAETPALEAEDRFRARLASCRSIDAESGRTTFGTHRSDLAVTHLARNVPARTCSTGEQKALLISVVLANARLLALDRSTVPLLLLDELAAHLDAARRGALYDEILALGAQAWVTGTDPDLFAPFGDTAQYFHVADATVRPETAPATIPKR